MTNFSIYRKTTGTLKIPRKTSGDFDIYRKTAATLKIDMPVIIPPPAFVSAEVGTIDAYTIDMLFDLALWDTKIPDAADLIALFSGGYASGRVSDADGNIYTYVTIGTQQWLVQNLRTTKYADGTSIPNLTLDADWIADTAGAYCWYNNDIANKTIYGALYNWHAVNNAAGLAPSGWRVPSSVDYQTLITFLGASAGGHMKEIGTDHWNSPNTGADNSSGFTMLGAGSRHYLTGVFGNLKLFGINWASDDQGTLGGSCSANNTSATATIGSNVKARGISVRCMRDLPATSISLNGLHCYVPLDRAITAGETGTIQYVPNALEAKKLQGTNGARVVAFTEDVTNNVTASIPVLQSITVEDAEPTFVVFTYDMNLDGTSIPANTVFTISGKTNTGVPVISGMTIKQEVTVRYYWGDTGTAAYTKPGTNMIKSLTGGEAASFTATAVTNNIAIPAIISDANTVAWFKPTEAANVTAVAGVESIYWDMKYGKMGALGAEQDSGVIVKYAVYYITATQANFFYTGCQVGDTFACNTVKTCDANNKVQRYTGNHLTQPVATNQPTNQIFDGIDNFMKTAPFTLNQPVTVYLVCKQITWTTGDKIYDGNTNDSLSMSQYSGTPAGAKPRLNIYAGTITTSNVSPHADVGGWVIIRAKYNGATSELKINNTTTPWTGNIGTNAAGGITLCRTANINSAYGNIAFKEMLWRDKIDSDDDYTLIYKYLENKYFTPISQQYWTPQGTVLNGEIAVEGSENIFEPSVIYEGNAQILSGNVFKMWYTGGWGANGIYYAESTDGLTWTKLSTGVLLAGYRCSHVFKLVDTYYLYAPDTALTQFDLYTSSDGITFTLDTAAVLVKDPGTGWDNGAIANIHVIIEAGVWYMFYEAYKTTGGLSWQIGLATSNDGRVWVKQASPIMPTSMSRGGPNVHKIGSEFYMWCHGFSNGLTALPTDLFRYKSTDLITWVRDVRDLAYHRVGADEGEGYQYGQVADIFIIEVNGQCYMFHSATANGNLETGHLHIKLAIADMTLAELVLTQEGRIV